MKPAPHLSDEEIRSYMDFGNVLKKQKALTWKRNLLRWISAAAIVSTVGLVALWLSTKEPVMETKADNSATTRTPASEKNDPLVAADSIASQNDATHKDNSSEPGPVSDKPVNTTPPVEKAEKTDPAPAAGKSEQPIEEDIYVQAEPVEGYDKLYEYFQQHLRYPEEAMKDSAQGAVVVVFVVKPDGVADNIVVRSKLGEPFTREVVQLIKNMPAWKPASLNGKPVPSRITLPLTFQLERIKK